MSTKVLTNKEMLGLKSLQLVL